MHAQSASQRLTKIPASPVAIAVDNADFIIAEAVNAIFVEQEKRIINKKLPHATTLEVENISARPSLVGEKERVPILRRSIFGSVLPIKEPQTFSSETAACMVEDKVKNNGKPISVAEIDKRLKLIHLAAEMLLFKRR